jgi:hypothetical protein
MHESTRTDTTLSAVCLYTFHCSATIHWVIPVAGVMLLIVNLSRGADMGEVLTWYCPSTCRNSQRAK